MRPRAPRPTHAVIPQRPGLERGSLPAPVSAASRAPPHFPGARGSSPCTCQATARGAREAHSAGAERALCFRPTRSGRKSSSRATGPAPPLPKSPAQALPGPPLLPRTLRPPAPSPGPPVFPGPWPPASAPTVSCPRPELSIKLRSEPTGRRAVIRAAAVVKVPVSPGYGQREEDGGTGGGGGRGAPGPGRSG